MKLQYVRAFIVLVAGLVALIVNIRTQRDVTTSLFIVLVVLIIFCFLGTLIIEILQKSMEQRESFRTRDREQEKEIVEEAIEEEEITHVAFDEDEEEV